MSCHGKVGADLGERGEARERRRGEVERRRGCTGSDSCSTESRQRGVRVWARRALTHCSLRREELRGSRGEERHRFEALLLLPPSSLQSLPAAGVPCSASSTVASLCPEESREMETRGSSGPSWRWGVRPVRGQEVLEGQDVLHRMTH